MPPNSTETIPSKQSDELLLGREPRATVMPSIRIRDEWQQKIKDQATFSARTTSKTYLDNVRKVLAAIAARQIIPQEGEKQLRASLERLGYRPETGFPDNDGRIPPATPGSITDLSSSNRIRLIIDTNVRQARSLGQIATSENSAMLMTMPAWKLARTGARKKPRGDWKARWEAAGNSVGWKGASKKQYIALKTSPIWQAIGDGAGGFGDTLGSPYPPFAFGSGMSWVGVDWDDWEELCEKEDIPNGLEEIIAKAKELKARKAQTETAQERPVGALLGGADKETGKVDERAQAAYSPLFDGAVGRTAQTPPTEPPPDLFQPDFKERLRADRAVDSAIESIRQLERGVIAYANEIAEIRDACQDRATEAGLIENDLLPSREKTDGEKRDRVEHILSGFDKYLEHTNEVLERLRQLEGKVVGYGASVGAVEVPADKQRQRTFDAAMNRWAAAARSAERMAKASVRSAALRRDAAQTAARMIDEIITGAGK